MKCPLGWIISEDREPTLRFGGGQVIEGTAPPSECPTCHRLFPLTKQSKPEQHPRFLEVNCNRADDHPRVGEHWHETPHGARISFTLTKEMDGGMWTAGTAVAAGSHL